MARKRRLSQTPVARLRRQATAYARLGAKAHRAGDHGQASRYIDMQIKLMQKANRIENREAERAEQAAAYDGPKFKDRI